MGSTRAMLGQGSGIFRQDQIHTGADDEAQMTRTARPAVVGSADARAVHGWSAGADLVVLGAALPEVTRAALAALMLRDPVRFDGDEAAGARGLTELAELAEPEGDACDEPDRPLVLVAGDVQLELPALLDLLDRPGLRSAALVVRPATVARGLTGAAPAGVGADGAGLESVGTGSHVVTRPSHVLGGVLRVDSADRRQAAEVWRRAAASAGEQLANGAVGLVDLATLALVRGDLPVRVRELGPFTWRRGSADAPGAPGGPWQQRLRASSRGGDGLLSTYAVRPLSRQLTAVGLNRGWTPNAVTAVSLLLGLVAAALVLTGRPAGWVVAAVVLQLALVVDCVDGEIARFTRRFSALGAWLDGVGDRAKEYAVLAALGAVAVREGSPGWTVAIAAMALVTARHLEDYAYVDRLRPARVSTPDLVPLDRARDAGSTGDRTTFPAPPSRRATAVHWAKKVIHLPIAERYLLISLGLLTFNPLLVLWVMIVGASLALVWTVGGRLVKAPTGRDGIHRMHLRESASRGHLAAQLDLSVLAPLGSRLLRPWTDPAGLSRYAWLLPALLWSAEAITLGVVAAGQLDVGHHGAAYAWLAAVAYHRYDVVYRLRETGTGSAPWVSRADLGTEGRIVLVLAVALLAPAALPLLLWVGTAALLVVYATESFRGWRRWIRSQRRAMPLGLQQEAS